MPSLYCHTHGPIEVACYRFTDDCHHPNPDGLRDCESCHAAIHADDCPFWCEEDEPTEHEGDEIRPDRSRP